MHYWSGSVGREEAEPLLQVYEALVERGVAVDASRDQVIENLEHNEFELALMDVLVDVVDPDGVTRAEKDTLVELAGVGWPSDADMTPEEYVERGMRFRAGTTDVFPWPT
jgi:hypothetical protein